MKRISPINPIARAVALSRRRASVVPPKKGKGSFNRKKLLPVIEDYKGYKGN
jgi:stalled ribosome alternative rescue factor ArfA